MENDEQFIITKFKQFTQKLNDISLSDVTVFDGENRPSIQNKAQ